MNIGIQLGSAIAARTSAAPSSRSQVDRVADATINMFTGNPSDSDAEIETQSEGVRVYFSN